MARRARRITPDAPDATIGTVIAAVGGGDGAGEPDSDTGIKLGEPINVDPVSFAGNPGSLNGDGDNAGGTGDGEPRVRRKYTRRAPKEKALPLNLNGLEKLLVGTHTLLAGLTGRPEFYLDTQSTAFDGKSESAYLAQSIKDVTDHYRPDFIDQKTIDWINLFQALGLVYGTRLFAIRASVREQRAAAPVKPPRGVQPNEPVMRQGPAQPAANGQSSDIDREMRTGEVPGLGEIEFPPDHPLVSGRQH